MNILEWLSSLLTRAAMPSASGTLLASEQVKRVDRFRKAWDAYYGRHPKPLKVRPGQTDDNVTLNYARLIADKGAAFLFGGEVGFAADDEGAQAWLAECWAKNQQARLLTQLALNGAMCGESFIKLVHPSPLTAPYPRLIALDPGMVEVETAADDFEQVARYVVSYPRREGQAMTLARQVIEPDGAHWLIRDEVLEHGLWRTLGQQAWPWPFAPVAHCQNLPAPNEFWGMADLEEDILQLNYAVNFARSNLARIIKFHAHPKTWGRGFYADEMKTGVDELIVLPNENSELHNLEMLSNLESSRNFARDLETALHELSRVPEIASGKVEGVGALSGVALQILYGPLIEKTEMKRRLYGELLMTINKRVLALGGLSDAGVKVQWPELLASDPKVEREVALMDKQLGVSTETVLTRLGFDAEAEAQKTAAGAEQLGAQLLGAFDKGQ